jgi:pyridoxal/pyridoxine/pyridoxamine kinase
VSTHTQAKALAADVAKASGLPRWQVGRVVNALLKEAQEQHPDNVVLSAIDPLTTDRDEDYVRNGDADTVRAIVGQIVAATEPAEEGP